MNCPECGAPEGACETRYQECLVKEFTDVGYGAVHHLTVATYMLQHSSRLTKEGWLYERELLREFVLDNKSPEQVRKENKSAVDSGRRTFKIAAQDGQPKIDRRTWTKTILDIRLGSAEAYREDVIAWAGAALADVESVILD